MDISHAAERVNSVMSSHVLPIINIFVQSALNVTHCNVVSYELTLWLLTKDAVLISQGVLITC